MKKKITLGIKINFAIGFIIMAFGIILILMTNDILLGGVVALGTIPLTFGSYLYYLEVKYSETVKKKYGRGVVRSDPHTCPVCKNQGYKSLIVKFHIGRYRPPAYTIKIGCKDCRYQYHFDTFFIVILGSLAPYSFLIISVFFINPDNPFFEIIYFIILGLFAPILLFSPLFATIRGLNSINYLKKLDQKIIKGEIKRGKISLPPEQ